jgi:hypothetical protein
VAPVPAAVAPVAAPGASQNPNNRVLAQQPAVVKAPPRVTSAPTSRIPKGRIEPPPPIVVKPPVPDSTCAKTNYKCKQRNWKRAATKASALCVKSVCTDALCCEDATPKLCGAFATAGACLKIKQALKPGAANTVW